MAAKVSIRNAAAEPARNAGGKAAALAACAALGLAAGLAALAAPSARGDQPPERPNVILIVADDLGAHDLAFTGSDLHETPALDRLAREGLVFGQAYAAAPVCSPSRAALLTGRHPARLHMTIWREAAVERPRHPVAEQGRLLPPATIPDLPAEEVTLAERFAAAGYRTLHVGKWHLGEAADFPEAHGFDINIGGTHWGAPATHFFPYRGDRRFRDGMRYVPGLFPGREGDYLADRLTEAAIALLDAAGSGPFFLNLWHYGVHTPLEAPAERIAHYEARRSRAAVHQNPVYAAMVENLDQNVGRLLDALGKRGLDRQTIVVFTSDNGGFLGPAAGPRVTSNAPLRSGKGSLYEGGLRVPLIIRRPGAIAPGRSDVPVVGTDLYSTLLELAGLDAPQRQTEEDGLSLAPLLRDPRAVLPRDGLYFHYPHYYATTTPASALRAGRWKLVHYYEDDRLELYDLADDPGETDDLADRQPAQAAALYQQLEAWRQRVGAQPPERP